MPTNTNLEQFEEALKFNPDNGYHTGPSTSRSDCPTCLRFDSHKPAIRSAAIDLVRSELEGLLEKAETLWDVVLAGDVRERISHYETIKKETE